MTDPPSDEIAAAIPFWLDSFRRSVRTSRAYRVPKLDGVRAKLDQNENPFAPPESVIEAVRAEAERGRFNRYPEEEPRALVEAVAAYAGQAPDRVLVTHGSNEFVHTLGLAFVEPGTRVVLPSPMFFLFQSAMEAFGGQVVAVPARDDFRFDADGLVQAVRVARPALTVVATPNNPTGLSMSAPDVERLAEATQGMLVVDEAYHEFTTAPSAATLIDRHPNVLVMRTLSKAFGAAGLRVGYVLGDPEVIARLRAIRLPFLLDRLTTAGAVAVLSEVAWMRGCVRAMKQETRKLEAALEARGLTYLPSDANFVLFRPPGGANDLLAGLREVGVIVRDMSGYAALKGWLRVCAGTEAENRLFLDALNAVLDTAPAGAQRAGSASPKP